jgi:hypothetical protein
MISEEKNSETVIPSLRDRAENNVLEAISIEIKPPCDRDTDIRELISIPDDFPAIKGRHSLDVQENRWEDFSVEDVNNPEGLGRDHEIIETIVIHISKLSNGPSKLTPRNSLDFEGNAHLWDMCGTEKYFYSILLRMTDSDVIVIITIEITNDRNCTRMAIFV